MVLTAAETNGEFVGEAQTGRGLARVEDHCICTGNSVDKLARQRCNAGHATEKVQRRAFTGQQRARRTFQIGDYAPTRNLLSFLRLSNEINFSTERQQHLLRDLNTSSHTILLRDDPAAQ